LKLEDFLALARYLNPHSFDFSSDVVEVWHRLALGVDLRTMNKTRTKIKPLDNVVSSTR
jgi:hypothetical protein